MPSFRIHAQHLVTYEYEVEADTLEAAIKKVEDEVLDPISPEIVDDESFEINKQMTEEANKTVA